ncbi:MAG: methylmalonyl Co-A mutase-associated GTPase MeaB [Halobacteria archaeon]
MTRDSDETDGSTRETDDGDPPDDENQRITDGGNGYSIDELVDGVKEGHHRDLARTISTVEDRMEGYMEVVERLHGETGGCHVVGITGSPGAGKSTVVDRLVEVYRDRGLEVGVLAVDPSSPYTGGSLLGDRIRLDAAAGDMDVFFRSMSTRGVLGGLAAATDDAVTVLDAFGKDVVLVETVGAGQNEIEIVETADTVAVLVTPTGGDDIQMLKAGILEIGDVFVLNKADLEGTDRMAVQLKNMIHHSDREPKPRLVETVAVKNQGIEGLADELAGHRKYLEKKGLLAEKRRERKRSKLEKIVSDRLRVLARNLVSDVDLENEHPYTVAEKVVSPVEDCIEGETRRE